VANHPLNLAFRFGLELAMLAAWAVAGWSLVDGRIARVALAVLLPLAAAALWGVFRVPGDGGAPVVAVAGPVRLALEALLFGGAVAALAATGHTTFVLVLGGLTLLHYALSYDRVLAFLRSTP
jgi:hypothetical protein